MTLVFQLNLQLILNLALEKSIHFLRDRNLYTFLSLGIFMQKNHNNWSRRLAVIVREIHRRNNEPKTETWLPSVKYYPLV